MAILTIISGILYHGYRNTVVHSQNILEAWTNDKKF